MTERTYYLSQADADESEAGCTEVPRHLLKKVETGKWTVLSPTTNNSYENTSLAEGANHY